MFDKKAWSKEYYKKPEVKERYTLNRKKPHNLAKQKARRNTPEAKEKKRLYDIEYRKREDIKALLKSRYEFNYAFDHEKMRLQNNKATKIYKAKKRVEKQFDPVKHLLTVIKGRARARGLEFNLEKEDLVIPTHCPIYQTELISLHKDAYHCVSVDRFDNSKGYIKGNVKIISKRANSLKSNATIEIIERLLAYMKGEI